MNKISNKIMLGYAAVLLVAAISTLFLVSTTSNVKYRVDQFVAETLPELNDIESLGKATADLQIVAYALYGTTVNSDEYDQKSKRIQQDVNRTLDAILHGIDGDRRQNLKEAINQLFDSSEELRMVMVAKRVDWDGARNVLAHLSGYADGLQNQLNYLKDSIRSHARDRASRIGDELRTIIQLNVIVVGVIALVTILAYLFSGKIITRPIRDLSNDLEYIADNYDLTRDISSRTQDEIGQVAGSVNKLLSAFNSGLGEVRSSSGGISDTAATLSTTSSETSQNMQQLSSETDALVGDMIQLSENIQQGVERTEQVAQKAELGADEVKHGSEEVEQTSDSIGLLAKEIEVSTNRLLELRTSGDKVTNVVVTIKEIAEQTNLLALNAAIEAARAGESGRGFAVVADEVRTLAIRTEQSTQEIQQIMTTIVNSITDAASAMESNKMLAGHSVELARKTVETLSNIRNTILILSDESMAVASEANQSQHEVLRMRERVSSLKAVGDSVLVNTQDNQYAATQLSELATKLKAISDTFILHQKHAL